MCGDTSLEDAVVDDFSQNRMLPNVKVPAGLVLKTDRIGEKFLYGDELVPGETVRFNYDDGNERNVLVVKTNENGFEGLTLERDGDYRRYDENKMSDITVVEPFIKSVVQNEKRVRFDEAGEALLASLSGEQLAELYNKHVALIGNGASFDTNSGEVVVQLPNLVKPKFEQAYNGFNVVNKYGQKLRIHYYQNDSDEPVGLDRVGYGETNNIPSNEWTPETLRDELVKLLA